MDSVQVVIRPGTNYTLRSMYESNKIRVIYLKTRKNYPHKKIDAQVTFRGKNYLELNGFYLEPTEQIPNRWFGSDERTRIHI